MSPSKCPTNQKKVKKRPLNIIQIIQRLQLKIFDTVHRNFCCPRDILVREMPYFHQYLCMNLADAEISVHCDIRIFEWLIKYVKRDMSDSSGNQLDCNLCRPTLEPQHAISILISSYFLEMECLVEETLDYCHHNMSAVLETNGNLSCISQPLLTR